MKIFISYAHEDEKYKKELLKHLSNLQRKGVIDGWHDGLILPSEQWDTKIKEALHNSEVILFLISSDFLASDYIHNTEIKVAFERYEKGAVKIIPVILRPCLWSETKLSKFQALPKGAKALSTWDNLDEGLLDVVQGIAKIIEANPPVLKDTTKSTAKSDKKEETKTERKIVNQTAGKIYNINKIDKADFS